MILGIYGISGIGKSVLCEAIGQASPCFRFIDGSAFVDEVVPGGLSAFKQMSSEEQYAQRERVVRELGMRHKDAPYHTVIAGHYSFLQTDGRYDVAWTDADGDLYDRIFCIEADAEQIKRQCLQDIARKRTSFQPDQSDRWQRDELNGLQAACSTFDIPFSILAASNTQGRMLEFFQQLSSAYISEVTNTLLGEGHTHISVFDCDGTLFAGDCLDFCSEPDGIDVNEVCSIFKQRDDYCFESFFDVARYYAGRSRQGMEAFIKRASESITLAPDMLRRLTEESEERIVWITSGFPEIWEAVALRYDIPAYVVGGNDLAKGAAVISNEEKALLVQNLENAGAYVTAHGDSMADAQMLQNASKAVVVVSKKRRDDLFSLLSKHNHLSTIDIRHSFKQKVSA